MLVRLPHTNAYLAYSTMLMMARFDVGFGGRRRGYQTGTTSVSELAEASRWRSRGRFMGA